MISLRDVRVPRKNVIGKEGEGFGMVMGNFNPERLMLASSALVLARACLVDAWEHAMRRKTFGKKLVGNQVGLNKPLVQHVDWTGLDCLSVATSSYIFFGMHMYSESLTDYLLLFKGDKS